MTDENLCAVTVTVTMMNLRVLIQHRQVVREEAYPILAEGLGIWCPSLH